MVGHAYALPIAYQFKGRESVDAKSQKDRHFYETEELPNGLRHDPPSIQSVGPRPIAWISSAGIQGQHQSCPHSFFTVFLSPPIQSYFPRPLVKEQSSQNVQTAANSFLESRHMDLAQPMKPTAAAGSPMNVNECKNCRP